jgi:hypothetical protein
MPTTPSRTVWGMSSTAGISAASGSAKSSRGCRGIESIDGVLARAPVILLGLVHRLADHPNQPHVRGQPEDVVHTMDLAPGHDRLAAEPAVAAVQDLDVGQARHICPMIRCGRFGDSNNPVQFLQFMVTTVVAYFLDNRSRHVELLSGVRPLALNVV